MTTTAGSQPPPQPTVTLAFGSTDQSWDDRELVNAYDAALLEFHVHNPGPGSWLDKATAALANGRPLPGANAFGTEWYNASKRSEPEPESRPAAASSSTATWRANKRARTAAAARAATSAAGAGAGAGAADTGTGSGSGNGSANRSANRSPYSPSAPASRASAHASRVHSPTYSPPSPVNPAENEDEVVAENGGAGDGYEDDGNYDEDEYYEEDAEYDPYDDAEYADAAEPHWDLYNWPATTSTRAAATPAFGQAEEQGHIFPAPSAAWHPAPAAPVRHDEAVGYALHAQYWAGYWMGVAAAASRSRAPTAVGGRGGAGGSVRHAVRGPQQQQYHGGGHAPNGNGNGSRNVAGRRGVLRR